LNLLNLTTKIYNAGAHMDYQFFAFSDKPEMVSEVLRFTESTRNHSSQSNFGWPIFEFQSCSGRQYWSKLHHDFSQYQFFLSLDEQIIASCFTIPFHWQGNQEDLPDGWDKVLEQGFLDKRNKVAANSLSLLAITVSPKYQGKGISKLILNKVRAYVGKHKFQHLVAPVRPVLKQFYPLAPISEYAEWKTKDGKPFDPWLRVHLSMGARLIKFAPESLTIEGSVSEWETWADMKFPASGDYIVPGALSTVTVSVENNKAIYYQPNIWLRHNLADGNRTNLVLNN
jgi:GNAT superfamily N-acetyltransferase